MSIAPGTTVTKDPEAEKVYTFDWSAWLVGAAVITTSTFIISGPDTALEFDDDVILSPATSTQVLLTGGTIGKTYVVTNRIVTNESPAQTDDKSIKVKVVSE